MRHGRPSWIIGTILVASLGAPFTGLAQEQAQEQAKKHKHYTLVDLGPFGGPISLQGTIVGGVPTSVDDPDCLELIWGDPSCHYVHAFKWRQGVVTDLGTLPGGNNSRATRINSQGTVLGLSENGLPDPVYGVRAFVATVWKDGEVQDLGTLGGGLSLPGSINDRGRAVGAAMTTSPDPDGYGTAILFGPDVVVPGNHWHAVLWQNGTVQDLGTLGNGLDSSAVWVNQRGQVAGHSWTDSIPGGFFGIPTLHPFLWENGAMVDLGSLGGMYAEARGLNNRGQVIGFSTLTGDLNGHAFLWADGAMQDLGYLGGSFSFSEANAINDKGEIAGHSYTADETVRGFRWKRGVMTDLGSVPGYDCSNTGSINASSQIVGWAYRCDDPEGLEHPVLWEKDGPGIDLNVFVPPGSDLELIEADWINDRGEIVGQSLFQNQEFRSFLLIPGEGDATEDAANATATEPIAAPAGQTSSRVAHTRLTSQGLATLRAKLAKRHRFGLAPLGKAN